MNIIIMDWKKQIFWLLLILFFLSSCEKVVQIDIPREDELKVLHSFAKAGDTIKVLSTRTYYVYDYIGTPERDSTAIQLFVNGQQKQDLLFIDEHHYSTNYIASSGDEIEIKTLTKKGLIAGSTTTIPDKPIFNIIDYKHDIHTDYEGDKYSQMDIRIEDAAGEQNFYELDILHVPVPPDTNDPFITTTAISIGSFLDDDPIIKEEDIVDFGVNKLIFSDKLFDGQNIEIGFTFYVWRNIKKGLIVNLSEVSEDYYLYMRSKIIQRFINDQDSFTSGYYENLNLHSNIENGFGIFASYATATDTIFIENK